MKGFLTGLIISSVLGLLVTTFCLRRSRSWNLLFILFCSLGLGLGLSAQITFYGFLMAGRFSPSLILAFHIFLVACLVVLNVRVYKDALPQTPSLRPSPRPLLLRNGLLIIFFVGLFHILYTLAGEYPFGRWDGWALWNMKAKFLITSGTSWRNSFNLHWHTQPDYPLLVPLMHVWNWSQAASLTPALTSLTSICFTLSCCGLLFTGLKRYGSYGMALTACCLLFFLLRFLDIGIAQYADVVLAYFLLAATVTLTCALREQDQGFAILAGLFLGLMSFTKNEGIVMALLLFSFSILYLLWGSGRKNAGPLITGLTAASLATALPIVIFKTWFAPPNRDIMIATGGQTLKYFNGKGLMLVGRHLLNTLMDPSFHYLWILLLVMFVLGGRRYFTQELKVFLGFFICYFLVVVYVYLTTAHFDLNWRLIRTLPRVLLILLPALLFLNFYAQEREPD